ncbi:putative endochitinase CHI2 [Xylaria sp. CBS 124048]|nr:putative endochitinase CHI2 [Xylaria sp. CBS 124048]
MHFSKVSAGLGLMAGAVSAFPTSLESRASSGPMNVVYWGQNGGSVTENNDLSSYCQGSSGIDILVLAFLNQYGQGKDSPSGTIGQSCSISNGAGSNCDELGSAITTCQSKGIKVMLSLGGAVGPYSLASSSEAQKIADSIWASYGGGSTSGSRPFGKAVVDGFDFDLESNDGHNAYYADLIKQLRSNFSKDSKRSYYITGAPQCPLPEPNMSVVIDASEFDYLWPQFYNNACALPVNGASASAFNFQNWLDTTAKGPSAKAKIFVGVPASPLASNGEQTGAKYYATPDQLADIVSGIKGNDRFGGVMMWAAGFSDGNVIDGCTYAQQVRSILDTGKPCGNGPAPVQSSSPAKSSAPAKTVAGGHPTPTASPKPTKASSVPTKTPAAGGSGSGSGSVAQWGQCGGQGYSGPTTCQSPFKCVKVGDFWSQCE